MAGRPREKRSTSASRTVAGAGTSSKVKIRSKAASTPVSGRPSEVKDILQRYLTAVKNDHVCLVKNVLAEARADLDSRSAYGSDGKGGHPNIIYDNVSPFSKMKSKQKPLRDANGSKQDVLAFKVRHFTKPGHSSTVNEIFVPTLPCKVTPGTPLPRKCRAYTTLRSNIIADNQEEMRYLPYFGEDDSEKNPLTDLHLGELFVDKTASNQDALSIEYAAIFAGFMDDFLAEVKVSIHAMTHYLTGDIQQLGGDYQENDLHRARALPDHFEPQDIKIMVARTRLAWPVGAEELKAAETVCRIFKQTTAVSAWEVIRKVSQPVKNSMFPTKYTTTGASALVGKKGDNQIETHIGGNPWPYSLDSYAHLYCLVCFMHECPLHTVGSGIRDRLGTSQEEKEPKSQQAVSKEYKLSMHIPQWSYSSEQARKDAFAEGEACSTECFTIDERLNSATLSRWSEAQLEVLRTTAGVLRNNLRCSCFCAVAINKPCAEIYLQLKNQNLLPVDLSDALLGAANPADDQEAVKVLKRKKTPVGYFPGYPADIDRTHLHERRMEVRPCRHEGPCDSACECVRARVACEKTCACPPNCPRKWRGCSCKRGNRPCSAENKCMCQRANRECDPDLCGNCGSYELLDPCNRNNDTLVISEMCQNAHLLRGVSKKTILGHSILAGMGLFMGENVSKNEFIGEYKGEVVTQDEAERRGKLYDKRGISFLFDINKSQAIDATRMGNKLRFINHARERTNCVAKIRMVNCVYRIGFWATKPIKAGEELFFDYGYGRGHAVKFVQMEPPYIPWSDSEGENEAATAAAIATKTEVKKVRRRGPRRLEYLKGGRGTTERTRKSELQKTAKETTPKKPPREESPYEMPRVIQSTRKKASNVYITRIPLNDGGGDDDEDKDNDEDEEEEEEEEDDDEDEEDEDEEDEDEDEEDDEDEYEEDEADEEEVETESDHSVKEQDESEEDEDEGIDSAPPPKKTRWSVSRGPLGSRQPGATKRNAGNKCAKKNAY